MLLFSLTTLISAAPERSMTIRTTVNGMVCSFCAQGILAHFKKHEGVSDVKVDLTRKIVLIEEKKGHLIRDEEIIKFIKKSGFDPVKIERLKVAISEG